jgi:anti-anti-sigma factor
MSVSVQHDEFSVVLAGSLRIEVTKGLTTTTIALRGEWDLSASRAADEAVHDALADRPELLVLDLSGLSFIDSSGIHRTVALVRGSADLGIRLVIVRGPRAVQRVFEVCQLTERLPFLSTSEARVETAKTTAGGL